MKLKRYFILGLVLLSTCIAPAVNTLKIQDVKLVPGESVKIDIELDNEALNLMGWQCDIVLPEGLSLAQKTNGKPAATLGDRFSTTGHAISSNILSDGAYRFVATSLEGEAIPGTSGTLFTVTLQADASVKPGDNLTCIVKNIELNTQDNQKLSLADVTFSVIINNSTLQKCATPTISMENGKLKFLCETEGATCHYTTIGLDKQSGNGDEMSLFTTYQVSVYATKEGYNNSDTVTKDIDMAIGKQGDVNADGSVNVADHVKLSEIIMENP